MQLCKPYNIARQIATYVQHSPAVRSVAYLSMAAATLEVTWRLAKPTGPYAPMHLHLRAIPLVAALTYGYVSLRTEDRARWNRVPLDQGIVQALWGIGLGTGAFLAWIGIAANRGWVSSPAWGWEGASIPAVARSVAFLMLGDLAVVWDEEMVFRGYGFETLQAAVGRKAAIAVLVPLFALYHGVDSQKLVGMAAGGTVLTLLRLHSDALWLPIGYHWAWNVTQTAIFGPAEGMPSIRPLQVHGPYLWVGRPGLPEPGLLSTLISLVMALMIWLWMRRAGSLPAAIHDASHTRA